MVKSTTLLDMAERIKSLEEALKASQVVLEELSLEHYEDIGCMLRVDGRIELNKELL